MKRLFLVALMVLVSMVEMVVVSPVTAGAADRERRGHNSDVDNVVRCAPDTLAVFRDMALSASQRWAKPDTQSLDQTVKQAEQLHGTTSREISVTCSGSPCVVCCGEIICCASCPGSGTTTCCGPVNCTDYPKAALIQ
ncbi:MAG: hypothetical protein L7F78_00485 [Syntrophales bacterium LBB04]|nr:hypothetical protein [Syntrophales bacterium LBB04]